MRNLVYAIFALVLISACAEKKQTISGEIDNLGELELVIHKFTPAGPEEVAKTKAVEGKFSLEYSTEQPDMFYIKCAKFNIPVFLDESSISITGDADIPNEILVEGSETDTEFKIFEDLMKEQAEEQTLLRQQYRDYSAKGDEENMKAIYGEYEAIQQKMIKTVKDHIAGNNSSYVSAFLANVYFGNSDNVEELKEIFNKLDKSLEGYSYYDNMKKRFESADMVSVGSVAPDFILNDPAGKPVSLSSFRGKYMLVDFWASWCGPCRKENPNVVALYAKYGGDKFGILGVSLDKTKEAWEKAIADDQLTWNHVSDLKYWKSEAAQIYGVKSIPHTVLIDPNGIIIAKNLRGKALEDKLASLLN